MAPNTAWSSTRRSAVRSTSAATTSRWRWLWLLHPLVTLLVIVGTANHFWLDALAAAALVGLALAVVRRPRHAPAPAPVPRPRSPGALVGAGR